MSKRKPFHNPELQQRRKAALNQILEGKKREEVIRGSVEEGNEYYVAKRDVEAVEELILDVLGEEEIKNTLNLHIKRYEDLYHLLKEGYGNTQLARRALRLKEDLLALNRNEVNVQVNNNTLIEEEQQYDFEKLSEQDRIRLEELLMKCRK
jgi:hypothetical protein